MALYFIICSLFLQSTAFCWTKIRIATWLSWLSLCWFLQYMKNHAYICTILGNLKKSSKIQSHFSQSHWWNCESIIVMAFCSYLDHTMQLFRKLFLIKLCRIRIWIIINLIENYRRIICKTRLPKYFRFTHICANILCGCNDTGINMTSQVTHKIMHRFVFTHALTHPSGPWVAPISQCTVHHA